MKMFKNIYLILLFTLFFSSVKAQYLVPEYVQNYDDTKPTVYAVDLGGGYQQVADSAAKADIPADKRVIGMMVSYVYGGNWRTERYEGTDVLNVNWRNESNWYLVSIGGIAAAGATGNIQFNTGGVLDADPNFNWDGTTFKLISSASIGNLFIGSANTGLITTSTNNTFIGNESGIANIGGNNNVFFGFEAGKSNTSGTSNVFLGANAANDNTTGQRNVIIGNQSGFNNIGSGNILIGYQSAYTETTLSNKLYIENTSSTTPLIYGDFTEDSIRINGNLSVKEELVLDSLDLPYKEGALFYDKHLKAPSFYNDIADFTHQLGYEFVARYYNNTGVTITNGTALTPIGQKINGAIIPTVQLAGNMSEDSLRLVGMSTTTTLPGQYGIVTLAGPVNGLDLSAFNDNDFVYIDHAGGITNIKPAPPCFRLQFGKVFYADNDSGQLFIFQEEAEFDPTPHVVADTFGISVDVLIAVQDVYYYLPIGQSQSRANYAFTVQGDSISPMLSGFYDISLDMSFGGNATAEVWNYGIFLNGTQEFGKTRSTSSSAFGDVKMGTIRYLDAGDWISFKIRNTSGVGDPTISDIGYFVKYFYK